MINDTTTHLGLPLPHISNDLEDDVARLRAALSALDAAVFAKAGAAEIQAALDDLIGAAPGALNSLNELAAAIGDDPSFAVTVASQIAAAQAASMPVDRKASETVLGGIKLGPGLTMDEDGVVTAAGGGDLQAFTEYPFTATAGQTAFTVPGGYTGRTELYLNGVLLMAGDDYLAVNGTTFSLTSGASAGDSLLFRKWEQFVIASESSPGDSLAFSIIFGA